MSTYIFSWYSHEFVSKIQRPKWWQVWKRATLYRELEWVRHCLLDIQEDEGKMLIELFNSKDSSTALRLIYRLMGTKLYGAQLENAQRYGNLNPSEYVSTHNLEYGIEPLRQNIMSRSEDLMGKGGWRE